MRLGYVLLYVPDVAKAVAFYEHAFDMTLRFQHESGSYAEMETGTTALGFVDEGLAGSHGFPFRPTRSRDDPPSMEIGLVCADVPAAFAHAVEAGALAAMPPCEMPWGQTVAYVRDLNGYLVEFCTPMAG